MKIRFLVAPLIVIFGTFSLTGCGTATSNGSNSNPTANVPWLGIPSMVNQVIKMVHESTGWWLNKSEVSVKKCSDRTMKQLDGSDCLMADFTIKVKLGNEEFETVAKDVPCDQDGIPTEKSISRIREAVESIKDKIKRLQG